MCLKIAMIRGPLTMTARTIIVILSVVSGLSCTGRSDEARSINVFLMPSPAAQAIRSFIPAFELATETKVHVTETPWGNAHFTFQIEKSLTYICNT